MRGKSDDLLNIPRIGKSAKADFENLGIRTTTDLISLMPRDYEDRREERRLSSLSVGNTTIYCRIRIRKKDYIPLKKGRTLKISATDDDGSTIELYCFNRDYLDKTVQINDEYYITATVSKERGVYRSGAFEIKKKGRGTWLWTNSSCLPSKWKTDAEGG